MGTHMSLSSQHSSHSFSHEMRVARHRGGDSRYAKDYRGHEGHVYVSDPGSDIIDMRECCYDEPPRNRQNLMQDMSVLHDMPVLKEDYNQVVEEDQQSLDSICENIEHSECSIECGKEDLVNAVEAARNRNFLYPEFANSWGSGDARSGLAVAVIHWKG